MHSNSLSVHLHGRNSITLLLTPSSSYLLYSFLQDSYPVPTLWLPSLPISVSFSPFLFSFLLCLLKQSQDVAHTHVVHSHSCHAFFTYCKCLNVHGETAGTAERPTTHEPIHTLLTPPNHKFLTASVWSMWTNNPTASLLNLCAGWATSVHTHSHFLCTTRTYRTVYIQPLTHYFHTNSANSCSHHTWLYHTYEAL